jgi:hypothetical protein
MAVHRTTAFFSVGQMIYCTLSQISVGRGHFVHRSAALERQGVVQCTQPSQCIHQRKREGSQWRGICEADCTSLRTSEILENAVLNDISIGVV